MTEGCPADDGTGPKQVGVKWSRRGFIGTSLAAALGAAVGELAAGKSAAATAAGDLPVLLPQGGGAILYRDVMLPVRMNRKVPGFFAKLTGRKPTYDVVHPYIHKDGIAIPNPDYVTAEFEVMHQQADALVGEFDPVIMPRERFDGLSFEEAVCGRIKEEGLDKAKPKIKGMRWRWVNRDQTPF